MPIGVLGIYLLCNFYKRKLSPVPKVEPNYELVLLALERGLNEINAVKQQSINTELFDSITKPVDVAAEISFEEIQEIITKFEALFYNLFATMWLLHSENFPNLAYIQTLITSAITSQVQKYPKAVQDALNSCLLHFKE